MRSLPGHLPHASRRDVAAVAVMMVVGGSE